MTPSRSATGYYTFQVLRAIGVDRSLKDLYVKFEVEDNVQRTRTIRTASEAWDERLPMRMSSTDSVLTFTVSRRLFVSPFTLDIGAKEITLNELLKRKEEKEEIELELTDRKQADPPRLIVRLVFSDVKTNASVALNNLLPLVDNNGEIPSGSKRMDEAESTIDNAVSQGKVIAKSKNAIVKAFPQIDGIVEAMDNIAQAHPLLNLGWQLVTIAYKVVSDQKKLDDRLNNLLRSAAFAFTFAQDASLLNEDDNRLQSIYRTIVQLMDQIIECSLFLREIVRYNFFRRMWTQSADARKVDRLEDGFNVLKENLKTGVDLQLGLFARDIAAGFDARAAEMVLREIRVSFGLTPITLDEMESSTHQECMPGTREDWINQIIDWLLSETAEETAFWVHGIPGSGKSTLAQTIARHPKVKDYLKSHIFFKRENTARHDIYILIAYRLAMSNAAVAAAIVRRLDKPRLGPRETFTNLILEPLLEAEKEGKLEEPIVIILDALDEFGTPESREPFLQLISGDFSKLPRCVRFLITSRPELDLADALTDHKHIRKADLEVDTVESRSDVQKYIATEMKKIVPNKAEGKQWEKMMTDFGLAADGLFIWASLAIRLVRFARRPYKKICELTSNKTPLTLDDLYRDALTVAAIDWNDEGDREFFAMLFTLILPNRGFVTIELFDLLLPFEGDSSESFLHGLQCFVSGGRHKSVQVYHKTFTDYLQADNRTPEEPWYIDVPRWNNFILIRCFMAMEGLQYDLCGAVSGSGDGELAIGEVQVHIIYASLYWADHLKDAEFSLGALELLRKFLNERLLFWFEILSLLKEFSRVAETAMTNAITWVSSHSPETVAFLEDARSIVSKFAKHISKSPMFIYSTALPLTASTNKVSQQYSNLHEKF